MNIDIIQSYKYFGTLNAKIIIKLTSNCITTDFYNIFSRFVYNNVSCHLFQRQSLNQYGITPGIRIQDALLCAESQSNTIKNLSCRYVC